MAVKAPPAETQMCLVKIIDVEVMLLGLLLVGFRIACDFDG